MMKIQETIDFSELKPYQPRRFVPEQVNLQIVGETRALFQSLIDRPVGSAAEFERWMMDRSELDSALSQTEAVLYIRMTCQTDSGEYARAFQQFIEEVMPVIQPLDDQLNRKFLELAGRFPLDQRRYGILHREIQTDIRLFRQENIPIDTRLSILSQEYQTICGAMTVEFEGKEQTLPQMTMYLQQTDRDLREKAWHAISRRRYQEQDKLESLFEEMLTLRQKKAINAGFSNYRDYQFEALHRYDYTPDDCKKFHAAVEAAVTPVLSRIKSQRMKQMNLDALRPWDLFVDPLGRPPLKPFEDVSRLVSGVQEIISRIDPELEKNYRAMAEQGLLDLASRKGKAPGGYQHSLDESRKPFIFMNAVGVDYDVRTLLHEAGHAFHSFACVHEPLSDYRHGPMEFNEVASMSMELLGDNFLEVFYSPEDSARSCGNHFREIVQTLAWVATVDAFQHWIYENPGHRREERRKQWVKLGQRFLGGAVDWTGLEDYELTQWHRQLHIFEYPFYYIEYAIAQLGALQVWANSRKDFKKAVSMYKQGLSFGGSRPLPELFEAAGIRFDFSSSAIEPLVRLVEEQLDNE